MAPGAPVPMYHCVPRVPSAPRGIEKSKVAAFDEPEFVTVALEPAAPVETVPTAIVAAAPSLPLVPASPLGIVKLNVAAELVPELLTAAELPATPVVTGPTATVAAVPSGPRNTVPAPSAGNAVPDQMYSLPSAETKIGRHTSELQSPLNLVCRL